MFLSSCVGKSTIKADNFLKINDCLYNDEYGIELNKQFDYYSTGFITDNNVIIEVFVVWEPVNLSVDFFDLQNIEVELKSKEDCFRYLDTEESRDNIILSGDFLCKDNTLIHNSFEGEYYTNVNQIVLNIKSRK